MKKAKILIVEDEPALMRAYVRVLEAEGYEVVQVTSGAEAQALVRETRPDLVLLDVMLPDESGLEVCRKLKADEETRSAFVIMISGLRTSGESQAEALEGGADGYLIKPLEPQALKAHVRAFLRIKSGENELRESERRARALVEELQEANSRLEEYNRLKAEFVANMSHELRTPLTAIIGFAQLVRMSAGANSIPSPYEDAFERILRNGRHLLALIDDVLDISKIEAGRMRVHREHIDLAEVVQSTFGELQSLAQRKGLEYNLRVPGRLPLAFTDPLRVRQVLINLLSNAIKFTAKGRVEVELLPWEDDRWRLVVSDTGIGIDERELDIIFERFRQVDGSMVRVAGGAGLGLSIVRQIVQLLGGEVEVSSKIGEGSIFTVTLPLVAPDPVAVETPLLQPLELEAAGKTDEEGAPVAPEQWQTILIIEDDPDAAALLLKTVSAAGYRGHIAPDGPAGLQLARALEPAAILLDVMMPGMDGWRVLQSLKSERRTARIPVIVCSIVDNRPLGYSLGASDYLLKPVEPERLLSTLRQVSVDESTPGEGYVLVVDDEHGIRELLTLALRHAGYEVRSATSGETALHLSAQSPPRAVLCDLMMPNGMSGFEFIARLRAQPGTARTPIIVVTGKDLMDGDRQLISGQIADLIRKGDLLMQDIESRLRTTLEEHGIKPANGQDTCN